MRTHDIWCRFRDHFLSLDHTLVPGSPLPVDDPTLLFVSAGMVPFKPYFLGEATPPFTRAVTRQKVLRTTDIDAVGRTARYNTFFQMAGSFAFADYFRTEAITYAWDLLMRATGDGGLGVDESRVWVTVLHGDDEAVALWRKIAGLPEHRIQRLGREDNLWNMGVPGPCGPSSEIFVDRGPQYGPDGGPAVDTDRFMELWNLVFLQDVRGPGDGDDYPILGSLPAHNIDTGMGLERTAVVLQDVGSIYETDLLRPLIDRVAAMSGRRYRSDPRSSDCVRMRIIADHIRSALMLTADGVTPSTDGRGYVLRRLIRRSVQSARLLGLDEPVVGELLGTARDLMAPSYPEIVPDFPRIDQVIRGEEEAFRRTLTAGERVFDLAAASSTGLTGAQAFALHDTHGFPIDLTLEIAAERGLSVDEAGFRTLMQQQRDRARSHRSAQMTDLSPYRGFSPTAFTGYDELTTEASVLGIIRDAQSVPVAVQGEIVEVILDRTPLYAASGGQASDAGRIRVGGDGGSTLDVLDVRKLGSGLWIHRVRVEDGEVTVGAPVVVDVDPRWRHGARQAHSATHIVHAALRQVLGPTALQSGSSNRPGHLRLDFAWPSRPAPEQLAEIETVANTAVDDDLTVRVFHTSLPDAVAQGAIALFGEAYGESVRVVEIGGAWSRELCGGTHVEHSSQVGPIAVLGESSVGSGVRRIEAYVGRTAFGHLAKERTLLADVAAQLRTKPSDLPERITDQVDRLRTAERELERARAAERSAAATALVASASRIGRTDTVLTTVDMPTTPSELRSFAFEIVAAFGSRPGVVTVVGPVDGRTGFVVATTATARERGTSAASLIDVLAPALGGRGGGTGDVAQGSSPNSTHVDAAFDRLRQAIDQS